MSSINQGICIKQEKFFIGFTHKLKVRYFLQADKKKASAVGIKYVLMKLYINNKLYFYPSIMAISKIVFHATMYFRIQAITIFSITPLGV